MARGDARRDVELVEDDGSSGGAPPDAAHAPADDAGPRRRTRRRALVLGAALVVVLVAAGVVAQVVVSERERERIAAVAGLPGVVGLLDGPVRVLDERLDDTLLRDDGGAAAGGLVVGVHEQPDGREVARAIDPVTGAVAWETELLAGGGPAEVAGGEVQTTRGACRTFGAERTQVVCLADDGVSLIGRGTLTQQAPTATRVVVLDAGDGSVVADLSDAAGDPLVSGVLGVLDDMVVLAGTRDGEARVRALTPDGTVAWDAAFPVTTTTAFGASVDLRTTSDAVAVTTTDALRLLDATGAVRREVPLTSGEGVIGTAGDAVVVTTGADTLLVRAATAERVPGVFLRPMVEAPASPGLVLTLEDATLHAWRPDGTPVWSVERRVTDGGAVLLPDRVLVGYGTTVAALDAATGAELWSTSGLLPQAGLVTDGRQLLTLVPLRDDSRPQGVAGIDLSDGDVAWQVPLPAVVTGIRGFHGVLAAYTFGADVADTGPTVTVLG